MAIVLVGPSCNLSDQRRAQVGAKTGRQNVAEGSKRILVVDDDDALRVMLCQMLQDAGYLVDSAGNGLEALGKIEATRPALVILDLMMPVMDGWQLLERLPAVPARPVVIVLSAFPDFSRAVRAGARACLSKPFSFRELLATCGSALGT